jgi:branched-chain amino acid transport system substrate-binding protein
MTISKVASAGAIIAALLAANDLAFAQSATGTPVKIGVIVDRSGIVVSLSQGQQESLKAAAAGINKGNVFWATPPATSGKPGILGRPIEFMFEDSQADPNQALSKSRRLASNGADAIIITTVSADMMQARLVCEEAKIICIGPSVANVAIVRPPNNAYAFTLGPSFDIQGQELIAALKAGGYTNLAIVRDDSGSSKAQSEAFKAVFAKGGITVVTEEAIPLGAREISGQLLRVRNAKPQAVLNLVNPPVDGALFMRSYQTSGIGAPLFAMGGLISQTETWSLAGPSIDGTIAVDYFIPEDPAVKDFSTFFREMFGKDRPILSTNIMPATSLLLLKRAMEDAGETRGEKVRAAVQNIKNFPAGFGQPGYTVNYSPEDHNGATNKSIVIVEFAGQKPSKVWPRYQPGKAN